MRSPRLGPTRPAAGFTLLEAMIVVAIIGLLTAFAYPHFNEQVRRGHRAEARAQLLDAAQFLQRVYSANDRYDRLRSGEAVVLPDAMRQVPTQGPARYGIVAAELGATQYVLEARPTGTMHADPCGTLTLNSAGQRGVTGASRPQHECWR